MMYGAGIPLHMYAACDDINGTKIFGWIDIDAVYTLYACLHLQTIVLQYLGTNMHDCNLVSHIGLTHKMLPLIIIKHLFH